MRKLIETLIVGLLMFVVIVGVILLIGLGLAWVLEYIPCDILVFITTGLLLGIFMLVANLFLKNKNND